MNMNTENMPPIATGYIAGDTTQYIRDFLDFSLGKDDHPQHLYYFSIVAPACYFESVLEDFAGSWCKTRAASEEPFLNRLMDKIADDVDRATGLERWKQWFRVLFDVELAETVGNDWQVLHQLFVLRNQLAHGRTTKFTHFWNANDGKFIGMTIDGSSYRRPFEHLQDAGVITVAEGEVPNPSHIFSHKVAQHFNKSVCNAIKVLAELPQLKGLEL